MILVDTSVWVDHLAKRNAVMERLLDDRRVLIHPFVIGELAMGSLLQRVSLIQDLQALPHSVTATDEEVLDLVSRLKLHGLGVGYIDVHLLTSVQLTPETLFWTRDKRLRQVVEQLTLDFVPDRLSL